MKINTNELGHMTRWPPCPYMVKTLKNLLRSFFDLGQRSLRFQSSNLFFSKTVGQFGTKVYMKA